MMWLKQSTAVTLKIGPFLDEDDGKTAEPALTIAQADVRLSKNGGDIAQKNEATSCTHDELGIYGCPLNTTDTGTLGILQLWVHESGALPVWHEYMVVPANVYDSLVGGTDALQVHANEITAGLITSTAIANDAITATKLAANSIDLATFAPDVKTGSALKAHIEGITANMITATAINANAITAAKIATDAITAINDGAAILNGTAQSNADKNIIILAASGPSAVDDFYNGNLVAIQSGTGQGQSRLIVDYTGGSKTATVDRAWETAPTSDSVYRVFPFSGILLADTGIAAASGASTITLAASAPAVADAFIGHTFYISGGTGVGQARIITGYTAGRVATVSPAWTTALGADSIYKILPVGRTFVNAIAADAITAASIATDAIDADALAADAVTEIGAEVNTQVSDVMKTDTIAEMAQGAPPATPTFEQAVMYVYMALRNKIDVTAALKEFHNDAGTVIWKKALSDDATTYSEAEGVSGP
jgi:hypothetical protein